ncbi:DEAD/DEAH box helicase [Acetobacteraceae bacterium KSS8]|uniref:DEAD/DEAH box helicase n=1 Tax=Endosaccharibacter trunci TaxID=2812733 RepID=A0ABT1WBT1_9PROT|nr:DEAD/DEAH box helicase [Acetobacteraceae bacterium KSS8]
MSVELRPYQIEMVSGFRAAFQRRHRRVLGQLPTGGGKGRLLGHMGRAVSAKQKRILIVAHRAELVEQICGNLDAEGVQHGRVQPGWPMLNYPVLVGMVQTVSRRLHKLPAPDLIMIDEAHHTPAGQYQGMLNAWPDALVLGVTATPARTDGAGLGDFFDHMVQGPSTRELIDQGFLAPYDYFLPSPDFDATALAMEGSDYRTADVLRAVTKAKIVGDAVQHYAKHLNGRPAIAFCVGVKHVYSVAEQFMAAGIAAAGIDGTLPMAERKQRLDDLAAGRIQVLTAADVVSEGVDIPAVAGAILLRPTCSVGLYLQQVGRALRPKPDGSRAIILDHVGNARKHGFPSDPRNWTLDGSKPKDAVKIRTCDTCLRAFPIKDAVMIAEQECTLAEDDPDERCPILNPVGGVRGAISEAVVGELEAVTDPWTWAGGIDPARAYGQELQALIARAQSEDHLRMIARARGYHHRWVGHQLRARAEAAQVAA